MNISQTNRADRHLAVTKNISGVFSLAEDVDLIILEDAEGIDPEVARIEGAGDGGQADAGEFGGEGCYCEEGVKGVGCGGRRGLSSGLISWEW